MVPSQEHVFRTQGRVVKNSKQFRLFTESNNTDFASLYAIFSAVHPEPAIRSFSWQVLGSHAVSLNKAHQEVNYPDSQRFYNKNLIEYKLEPSCGVSRLPTDRVQCYQDTLRLVLHAHLLF